MCRAGTASSSRASKCTDCGECVELHQLVIAPLPPRHPPPSLPDAGKFSDDAASSCESCAAGTIIGCQCTQVNICSETSGAIRLEWSVVMRAWPTRSVDDGSLLHYDTTSGTYSSAAGSTECSNCTKGSYTASEGSSTCGQYRGPTNKYQLRRTYQLRMIQRFRAFVFIKLRVALLLTRHTNLTEDCREGYFAATMGSTTCLKCTSEVSA